MELCRGLLILILLFFGCTTVYKNSNEESNKSKTCDLHSFMNKLYTYKLYDGVYITSVQYVSMENKLKIIVLSKEKDVNINYCIIKYSSLDDKCNPISIYRNEYYYLNLYEIPNKLNIIPVILIVNNITITIQKSRRNEKYKYVRCTGVLSNFNRPFLLIELIESSILFGVSKLVFYYFSSSESVKKILEYYSKKGIIDVYQYQNDSYFKIEEGKRDLHIFHFNLFKINHCFNEYKTTSNHMMFLDLDEIIWPLKHRNYDSLFNSIPKKDFYYIHSYIFKYNFDISDNMEKNYSVVLPDINIFDLQKYCPSRDGYVHKYMIMNTNKYYAIDIHESLSHETILKSYLKSNLGFIRHIRHFHSELKKRCPDKKCWFFKKMNQKI